MRQNHLAKPPLPFHNAMYWHNVATVAMHGRGPLHDAVQPARTSIGQIDGVPPMQGAGTGFAVPIWGAGAL